MLVCAYVLVGKYAMAYLWRSEDSLQDSALAYHVGYRDQIQVVRHGCKQVYPQSHLTSPIQKYCTQLLSFYFHQ